MKMLFVLLQVLFQSPITSAGLSGKGLVCSSFDGRAIGLYFNESDVEILHIGLDDGLVWGWDEE